MGTYAKLSIKESEAELRGLLKKQSSDKGIRKLNCLLYIKENRFKTRKELCHFLGIDIRTQERWLKRYKEGGMTEYLAERKSNRTAYLIPEDVQEGLKSRVYDSEVGFSSYVEAQRWVSQEYDLELNYNTIRQFLINKFKTKVKQPRKSHIKKVIGAEEAFLKTT